MERLRERADAAERRLEQIDNEIATALLDNQTNKVSELRKERTELLDDITDLAAAEHLADDRARLARENLDAVKRQGKMEASQKLEERRRKSASRIDAALKDLEAAYLDHERLCVELEQTSACLRSGRLLDLNIRKRMMISAFWNAAPKTATSLHLGFTPGNKRRLMAEAFQFEFTTAKEPF